MKRSKKLIKYKSARMILFAVSICAIGYSAPISPNEATAIADIWYAMELNSGYLEITEAEREDKFAQMGNREMLYMVAKDELLEEYPIDLPVLAYIVKYVPNGFVVVSGDDRIEPIMVCSAESEFRWDHPELNFLRYYLGKVMPALWNKMPTQTHRNWSVLRSKLPESIDKVTFDDIGRAVYVLWPTAPWGQGGYYNDTVQAHNGGNNIPTGCTATAMAIKMKFHSWPSTGSGSHSYDDTWGSVQYSHDVDYGAQTYVWGSMPNGSVSSPNSEVARIMYHAGVAVDMNYELAESGAWPSASSMNSYFRYRGTLEDTSSHDPRIQTSIIGKLPVVISSTSHTVLVSGYRDDVSPHYYLNCGWGGSNNSWYNLDSIPSSDSTINRSYPYAQPRHWVYVDVAYAGTEDGRIYCPFNTLAEGEAFVVPGPVGGELLIRSGFYTGAMNVPITFDKERNIRAYAGDVVIGENVYISNYNAIRLHNGGELKITPE